MKPLRQAIDDYITLRRSLGFKLRDMADGLRKFAAFLEQKAAPYVTTELAMEWAMQPYSSSAQRLGATTRFCPRIRPPLACYGPAHGDSPARFTPVSATTRPPLSVFGTGDSKAIGSSSEAFSPPGIAALDVPLPVRAVGGGRFAYQRGAQAGAAGCGSRRGHSHHPSNKVRQDPPGSAPHFHSGRHGRLRPTPRPVSAQPIVFLFLSQRSWPPSGRLCGSSNILRSVAADRLARAGGSQGSAASRFSAPIRRPHAGAVVSVQRGYRAPPAGAVDVPGARACGRYLLVPFR